MTTFMRIKFKTSNKTFENFLGVAAGDLRQTPDQSIIRYLMLSVTCF